MWMAALLFAASELQRSALPSIATTCPSVSSWSADPAQQAPLELGRPQRPEDRVEPVVGRDAGG
jgi:hypothetical protein